MSKYARLDSNFMLKHKIKKNVIVVGAWQTQSQIEIELMRPEFKIVSEDEYRRMKELLMSPIPEQRTRGEDLRKHIGRTIERDIHFCGYQSFFNLLFPNVKSESYGQNVVTLISDYMNGNISVSKEFLDNYSDSVVIIDEMQRLYSIDGLNSFGVAVLALSKLAVKYRIKIVFLTGTMINSSVREIVDIINIMSDTKTLLRYEDYVHPDVIEGINILKLQTNKYSEIVEFFKRKFMYYNQTGDKNIGKPQLLSYVDMRSMITQSQSMINATKPAGKKSMYTEVDADFDIAETLYSHDDIDADFIPIAGGDTPSKQDFNLSFIGFNQVFVPDFISNDKKMRFLTYPKVDLIPQEIHVGNTFINTVDSTQPMILYSVTVEGQQAAAYSVYINNFHNQRPDSLDEAQASENTVYVQDAYVPPPNEWMKYGITQDSTGNLYGKFLHKDNIRKFSAIGYEMLMLCFENAYNNEKTILYHNKLNAFGINQYALILQYNGFVKYGQSPSDKSLCRECRHTYSEHHQSLEYRVSHAICNTFKPMHYAVLSGAIQQLERDNLTNNVFNNPNNLYGEYISVMFVSDVAYSGVSFFNTNNIIILSRIPNVSKWKQIYSRIIRTRSHQGLPPSKQYAKVYTMTIDYPNELQKWRGKSSLTVGTLYYKQRELANEDIRKITSDISNVCISNTLFHDAAEYKFSLKSKNICNDLLREDIKSNMSIVLRRIMSDKQCNIWINSSFIRRLKDEHLCTTFIKLDVLDDKMLMNIVNETRLLDIFTIEKENDNTKFISYRDASTNVVTKFSTFDVNDLNGLKLASHNIVVLLEKLKDDTAVASVINHLARILKLCRKNYLSIVNSQAFWDRMYELGNEYYGDDESKFIENHSKKNRNKGKVQGCYYGNEIIYKDGSSRIINYKFPMATPNPKIPYTFKITCLVLSENSPFYIHVNVVKYNKDTISDRRRINKGVICTSTKVEELFQYFPKLDKSLPKKDYCKEMMWELCEMQANDDKYKFVFTPFEK